MAAAGLAVLGAAVIGGAVLLASDDGSDGETPASTASGAEAATELTQSIDKRAAGIAVSYPPGWRRSEKSGIVSLESPDRCAAISLSAPVPAAQAKRLREGSIAALRRSFGRIEVRRNSEQLGGLPTSGALIAVRNKQGRPVVIRLSVSTGKRLTYLTQVVLRSPPCPAVAPETAQILGSLRFSRC